MRWIGILSIIAALVLTTSAAALGPYETCPNYLERTDDEGDLPAESQNLLLDNRCEAIQSQELRAPLMRIPREEGDDLQFSFGVKSNGGMIRLKIPFSF